MDDTTAMVLSVPEIRDYQRINSQVAQWLDAGHRRVTLSGVEGQRLLLAGLSGNWPAVIEVEGRAGPELAANLDAPNLIVVARGDVADGAGRGLRAGHLLIFGDAGAAVAYRQSGGLIAVTGQAGPRAGLELSGGLLVISGTAGLLAAERQSGGWIVLLSQSLSPHAGRGQRGGCLLLGEDITSNDANLPRDFRLDLLKPLRHTLPQPMARILGLDQDHE